MIPSHLKVHTVGVAKYLGAGTYGESWADPVDVKCWIEYGNKLVTNATGQQAVSTAQVFMDVADEPPMKSKITVDGVARQVVGVAKHTSGGLSILDHVEVQLL